MAPFKKAKKGTARPRQQASRRARREQPRQHLGGVPPPLPTMFDYVPRPTTASGTQRVQRSSSPTRFISPPGGDRPTRVCGDKGVPSPGSTFSQDAEPMAAAKKQQTRPGRRAPPGSKERAESTTFAKYTRCWYTPLGGDRICVTVVEVHTDDCDPYYTVELPGGSERETVP